MDISEESMSNIPHTSGPLPVGVSSGGQEDEEDEEGDSHESAILDWLPTSKIRKERYVHFRPEEKLNNTL